MKNLEFRRQYLLTNTKIKCIDNWKNIDFPNTKQKLKLYYHPDLEVTYLQYQNRSIVLIGYIIDPINTDFRNTDILGKLLTLDSFQDLLIETENFNGRFAIIYFDGDNTFMFHDATGFREIYYCFLDNQIYCGSTPDIISKYSNIKLDIDKSINEFINSREFKNSGFWVGTRTPFKDVFHLQPNFYLDIDNKKHYRYWPNEVKEEIGLKGGANLMAKILKGTILAATNRYELHQALTSGYDSRVLLAASKDVKDQIKFFINNVYRSSQYADIAVSKRIAKRFKINFEIVEINNINVEDNFRTIFYKNNIIARETHLRVFYDAYQKKLDNTYWVTGTFGNEILRLSFPLKKKKISSFDIAKRFKYQNYAYANDSIEEWFCEAKETCIKYNYNLINLFYWEQFTANLKNLSSSEQDIIREEIRPFNCRKLITTYLSLKDKYRYKDYPSGHTMIIRILWKDLLKIPIAPYTNMIGYWFKITFRYLGLELMVNDVYNYLKSRLKY